MDVQVRELNMQSLDDGNWLSLPTGRPPYYSTEEGGFGVGGGEPSDVGEGWRGGGGGRGGVKNKKLTEAPLKMTGGGCHGTVMPALSAPAPLTPPTPASSAPAGTLTGAAACAVDGPPRAKPAERKKDKKTGGGGGGEQENRSGEGRGAHFHSQLQKH